MLQKPSLFEFLGDVVQDEDQTRRLGYLIRQVALALSAIFVSMAAIGYIWMYKSPILVKVWVGSGSTVFIAIGTLLVRLKRTARRELDPEEPEGVSVTLLPPESTPE